MKKSKPKEVIMKIGELALVEDLSRRKDTNMRNLASLLHSFRTNETDLTNLAPVGDFKSIPNLVQYSVFEFFLRIIIMRIIGFFMNIMEFFTVT